MKLQLISITIDRVPGSVPLWPRWLKGEVLTLSEQKLEKGMVRTPGGQRLEK